MIFLSVAYLLVLLYSLLITIGPLWLSYLREQHEWCDMDDMDATMATTDGGGARGANSNQNRDLRASSRDTAHLLSTAHIDPNHPYENPDYDTDPCRYLRLPELLYLTLEECDVSRRLLVSVILGGAIGYVNIASLGRM